MTSNRLLHVVMARDSIKKPEDLKGRKNWQRPLWFTLGLGITGSIASLQYRTRSGRGGYSNWRIAGAPRGALKVGAVDGAIVAGDTAFEAEKLGFHKVIDLSQLPIRYPGSTIVVSRSFLSGKRDIVKRFLRGWIEGIKMAKTDKEFTVNVMQKFLKTSDRSILEKTFEVYKSVHERVPSPDPKVLGAALNQLSATVPQAGQLKIEDFID